MGAVSLKKKNKKKKKSYSIDFFLFFFFFFFFQEKTGYEIGVRRVGSEMCIRFFFFKQKTAYEIASCLVGSEMCIRDSVPAVMDGMGLPARASARRNACS